MEPIPMGAQAPVKESEASASSSRARGAGAMEPIPMGAQAPVKIAMQYSPMNAIPYISRVDAGTVELVRSFGVEVLTSADLVQRFEAMWNADQYNSHCYAAAGLREIVDETFAHIRKGIRNGENLSEYSLQQFILSQIASRGMHTYAPPSPAKSTAAIWC
jgi:hypothetical protein